MRKLIAIFAAVFISIVAASPASASCTPGPRGKEGDTFHFTNPQTQGRQYVNVDGNSGQAYAGTTNATGTAYEEVVITWGPGGPSIDVYHRNAGDATWGDYHARISPGGGYEECGILIRL